ncbi:MAG: serine acetyltransferase [Muribaculum sp.]|nr:serine acetyltransferase [Muribaculum sp.]
MRGLNITHEASLRGTVERLSDGDNLTNVCPSQWRGEPLPSQLAVKEIITLSRALIFPGFFGDSDVTRENVLYFTGLWIEKLFKLLTEQIHAGLSMDICTELPPQFTELEAKSADLAARFIKRLPELRRLLNNDVKATYHGDPAALSTQEVIYCYPGIRAICNYRIAHELVKLDVPILPRMISEQAHAETGIDIHPSATIGESFTIDHGTGIVIGATAVIGNNVKIYQGVTLGAKSFPLDDNGNPVKGVPRHPTIGNNVIIYSNASILGRITIGDNAVIGGNIWVDTDVAPGERLIQAKANNVLRLKQ